LVNANDVPVKMKVSPLNAKWLLPVWILMSAAVLFADYFSGPDIALTYLFFVPVILATRYNGGFYGLCFAILLPMFRLAFYFVWVDPLSFRDSVLNTVIRIVVLVSAALLIDRVTRQAQEIRVLRGVLPVCSFCMKIRDSKERWLSLETYIADHSEAKMSHTVCPDCGRRHYGEFTKEADHDSQAKDGPKVSRH
jgi:hypothetical protein